jgi:hypothetical protein
MLMSQEWSMKYRDAMLERHPNLQLLRMIEAYEAIFHRIGALRETSNERRKLVQALDTLNRLRDPDLDRPGLD